MQTSVNTYRVFKADVSPDEGGAEALAVRNAHFMPRCGDDKDWAVHPEEDILLHGLRYLLP